VVDSDQFANRATAALRDDSVRALIAERITDDLVLANEADLITARPIIQSAASGVVGSPPFTGLFRSAVRDVHRSLFHGGRDSFTLAVADVGTVIAAALEQVRPSLARKLEANERVALVQRDLGRVNGDLVRLADRIRALALVLLALSLVLVAGALALSRDRRRTVVELGIAVAAAGVLLVVAYGVGRSLAIDPVEGPVERAAAEAVWDAFLGDLRTAAWILAGSGAVIAAAAASLLRPVDIREPLREAARRLAVEPRHPALRVLRGIGLLAAGVLVLVARDAVVQLGLTVLLAGPACLTKRTAPAAGRAALAYSDLRRSALTSRHSFAARRAVAPADGRLVAAPGAAIHAVPPRALGRRWVLAGVEAVGTGASREDVRPGAADQAVVAPAAIEHVVASAAVHAVVAPPAEEPVAARVARQLVVTRAAVEEAARSVRKAAHDVVPRTAQAAGDHQAVVAAAARTLPADQQVLARSAVRLAGIHERHIVASAAFRAAEVHGHHVVAAAARHPAARGGDPVVAIPKPLRPEGPRRADHRRGGRRLVHALAPGPRHHRLALVAHQVAGLPEVHDGFSDGHMIGLATRRGEDDHVRRARHVARTRAERVHVGRLAEGLHAHGRSAGRRRRRHQEQQG
jgi:hypothetical protein